MSKGKLIVLEGLDGSGKGTQAKLLAKHLTVTDHLVREITFPDYDSDSSALVKMYLAGQFGDKPDDVNAYAASSFYAVDRYAGYKSDWGKFYEEGGILIADRYTTSNAVHQCSKLPPEQMGEVLRDLYSRGATIVSSEQGYGIYFRREDTLYFVEMMAENDRAAEVLMEAAREKEVIVEKAVITVGAAQNLFLGEGTRQEYGLIRFEGEPFDVSESYMRLMMD